MGWEEEESGLGGGWEVCGDVGLERGLGGGEF